MKEFRPLNPIEHPSWSLDYSWAASVCFGAAARFPLKRIYRLRAPKQTLRQKGMRTEKGHYKIIPSLGCGGLGFRQLMDT